MRLETATKPCWRLIEEAHQLLAAAGLLELADGFGFDLADAFPRDLEDVADFFQRVAVAVAQAVPQLDDLPLAVAQGLEHLVDTVPQHLLRRAGGRALGGAVGKEVAKMAVLAVADGPIETDRVTAHCQYAAGLIDGRPRLAGSFLQGRLAAELLQQLPRNVPHAAHRLDHVDRNANRAALVGNGPRDRLANPPRGIGAELEATAIFELVDRPHQPGVAFLNQVEERQAAVAVLLRDRDDQPQVALRQLALGLLILGIDDLEHHHAVLEAMGRLLRGQQNVAVLADPRLALGNWAFVALVGVDLGPQFFHAAAKILERADHLLDPLRPQAELFHQSYAPPPATREPGPGGLALGLRLLLAESDQVVPTVALQQDFECPQVVRQAAENLVLLQPVGDADLHRAVERQFAIVHAL